MVKKDVYRAFNEEQIALLDSLRKESRKNWSQRGQDQHSLSGSNNLSPKKPLRPNISSRTESSTTGSLVVNPIHARQAKGRNFSWIPMVRNSVIEHMLRTGIAIRPRHDQLIVVGHLYWKLRPSSSTVFDTIYVGAESTEVTISRIDSAVEYAFSATRLAWFARISRGEAIAWEPVYVHIFKKDSLMESRELHFTVPSRCAPALQAALRSGILCLAVLSEELSPPRSQSTERQNPQKPKGTRKIRTEAVPYFKIARPSSTYQDGSALIASPAAIRTSKSGTSSRSSASGLSSEVIHHQSTKGRFLGLEWCSRCGGGEIPNCPQCDGAGYFRNYEGESPSVIIMGRNPKMSGQMSMPVSVGAPSSIADHEAVGRSDPMDKNRGASGIRDGNRFGSMPLYDNYDD